jgi:hypothetical protein
MTNPVVVRYRRNIDVWCMRCFGETHARRIVVDERCIAVALTDTCMVIATRVYDFVHYAAQGPCVAKRERSTLSMASALPLHGGGCLLHGWLLIVG